MSNLEIMSVVSAAGTIYIVVTVAVLLLCLVSGQCFFTC